MATYNSSYTEVNGRPVDPLNGIPIGGTYTTETYGTGSDKAGYAYSSSYQNGTGAQYGGQTTYTSSTYQAPCTETRTETRGGSRAGGYVERSGYVGGGYSNGGYVERGGYVSGGVVERGACREA